MAKKPNDDPAVRSSLTLRSSLWRAVEAFRRDAGLLTTAEAVRVLLLAGLRAKVKEMAR
jgi:hypothetical protein